MSESTNLPLINGKAAALIGFAIKSGSVVWGADGVARAGKRVTLVLMQGVGDSTRRRLTAEFGDRLIECGGSLSDIVHKQNCKVIGITDRQFAESIKSCLFSNS